MEINKIGLILCYLNCLQTSVIMFGISENSEKKNTDTTYVPLYVKEMLSFFFDTFAMLSDHLKANWKKVFLFCKLNR